MKSIHFLVSSRPDKPELGYGDHVLVYDNGKPVYDSHASTCPNPYKVNDKGFPIPWNLLYGWIADGEYSYKCIDHYKYGKCLVVNGGYKVLSRVPNPNHGRQYYLEEVFVHSGAFGCKNQRWRGSAGCPTIPPWEWPDFIEKFDLGETGTLIVRPFIDGAAHLVDNVIS